MEKEKLINMVENFSDKYLNYEYKELSRKLVEKMSENDDTTFNKGKLEIWASAVIYTIGHLNFLFEKSFEPYITTKTIFKHFGTKKGTVNSKAQTIVETFNLKYFDEEFSIESIKALPKRDKSDLKAKNFGKKIDIELQKYHVNQMIKENKKEYEFDSIEGCQKYIDDFKKEHGEEYFEEHEGHFWSLLETRKLMQCLYQQSELFWLNNQKDEAINQLKYMLKLNPTDNQGARDTLSIYLLESNRLEEVEILFNKYKDDYSVFWFYGRLLFDIKSNLSSEDIEETYNKCVEYNKYVLPYLLENKTIPDESPDYYTPCSNNEAIYYVQTASHLWFNDENALSILKEFSE